jgi:NADH-quinone oxidoreductase subunit L
LLGALLTGIYSFRLVFVVFFGPAHTEPDRQPGWKMAAPLVLLSALSLLGGLLVLPLAGVFPARGHPEASHAIEYISIGTPLLGLLLAYLLFLGRQLSVDALVSSPAGRRLRDFWLGGWRIDPLYDALWVRPYTALAHWWRNEPVDRVYNGVVSLSQWAHHRLLDLQTGQLRWYATTMVFGLVLLVAIMLRNAV